MIANKCLFCGSPNLRADRALSGRLICTSCGNPYGVRKERRNKQNNINNLSLNKKYFFYLLLAIVIFTLVII